MCVQAAAKKNYIVLHKYSIGCDDEFDCANCSQLSILSLTKSKIASM